MREKSTGGGVLAWLRVTHTGTATSETERDLNLRTFTVYGDQVGHSVIVVPRTKSSGERCEMIHQLKICKSSWNFDEACGVA